MNPVFLFAPDRLIWCCATDAPGSAHGSSTADSGTRQKMSDVHNKHQAKVAVDSAFNLSGFPCSIESS